MNVMARNGKEFWNSLCIPIPITAENVFYAMNAAVIRIVDQKLIASHFH